MVILILVVGFLLPRTRYGRRVIAVGGNRFAAQARGISLPEDPLTPPSWRRAASSASAGGALRRLSGPFDPGAANNLLQST